MFGKFSYITLITVSTIIPLFFVIVKYHKIISQYKKATSVLFLTWFIISMIIDYYTRKDGYWFNSAEKSLDLKIFGVPFEDILSSAAIGLLLPVITIVLILKEEKIRVK